MKVFIMAVLIMALTSVFVWWCGWYVNHVFDIMLGCLADLPSEGEQIPRFGEVYTLFEQKWFGSKTVVGMILGKEKTEKITEMMMEMGMRYIGGDICGYSVVKENMKMYLSQLKEGECIGVDTIL